MLGGGTCDTYKAFLRRHKNYWYPNEINTVAFIGHEIKDGTPNGEFLKSLVGIWGTEVIVIDNHEATRELAEKIGPVGIGRGYGLKYLCSEKHSIDFLVAMFFEQCYYCASASELRSANDYVEGFYPDTLWDDLEEEEDVY